MRKTLSLLSCMALALGLLTGCNPNPAPAGSAPDLSGKQLNIVTTIFPVYDWVREIMGSQASKAEITMLLDNGVDLHSYQPTADDIIKISTCDMFLYVGGESDEWAEDALKEAVNEDMVVINLMETLGSQVKEEEIVEGMEDSYDHEEGEDSNGEHHHEVDEHVWLSLKFAQALCQTISDRLCAIDPDNRAVYTANTTAYLAKLSALDGEYAQSAKAGTKDTLLFGDRFPFRYLADDYGLKYYAAFSGCSAESEASFETIAFLAGKVDELGLNSVLTVEGTNHKIAETIVAATSARNQKILTLNSLQSVTPKDVADGVTYLTVMENNLAVLKAALK